MAQRRNSVCYKVTGVNLEKLLTDKDETIVFLSSPAGIFICFFLFVFVFEGERKGASKALMQEKHCFVAFARTQTWDPR